MKRLFLVNSLIMPFEGEEGKPAMFVAAKVPKKDFVEIYKEARDRGWEVISAIGHPETAEFLSEIFGEKIEVARREVYLEEGDYSLVLKVEKRLEDPRKILTIDEMKKLDEEKLIGYYIVARVPSPQSFLMDLWKAKT